LEKTIGAKIKEYRKATGMFQYELAEKAGVSSLTIVRIENGQTNPHKATLKCIFDALGVTVEDIDG